MGLGSCCDIRAEVITMAGATVRLRDIYNQSLERVHD